MKELSKNEMQQINGSGLTASLINAVRAGVMSVVDIGRYFGSAIRRMVERNLCRF